MIALPRAVDFVAHLDSRRTGPADRELKPRLPEVIWLHDSFETKSRDFVVNGLIEPQSLVLLYGDAGSGKSTLAVDFAFAIATGSAWRDRPTGKGLVLHIAGEGARGLRWRQAAYCQHRGIPRTAPYGVLPTAVPCDVDSDTTLVPLVLEAAKGLGCPPRLVIIDTLARCLVGDENSGPDMAGFIRACDYLRGATGAAVMVLHHSGKDASRGARGHSSLHAAVDTELQVVANKNSRTLYVSKQRDLEVAPPMGFRLEPVALGAVDDEPVSACVVIHEDAAPAPKVRPAGRNQVAAITVLREFCRLNASTEYIDAVSIDNLLEAKCLDRKRRPEVLNFLVRTGVIVRFADGYTISREKL